MINISFPFQFPHLFTTIIFFYDSTSFDDFIIFSHLRPKVFLKNYSMKDQKSGTEYQKNSMHPAINSAELPPPSYAEVMAPNSANPNSLTVPSHFQSYRVENEQIPPWQWHSLPPQNRGNRFVGKCIFTIISLFFLIFFGITIFMIIRSYIEFNNFRSTFPK